MCLIISIIISNPLLLEQQVFHEVLVHDVGMRPLGYRLIQHQEFIVVMLVEGVADVDCHVGSLAGYVV